MRGASYAVASLRPVVEASSAQCDEDISLTSYLINKDYMLTFCHNYSSHWWKSCFLSDCSFFLMHLWTMLIPASDPRWTVALRPVDAMVLEDHVSKHCKLISRGPWSSQRALLTHSMRHCLADLLSCILSLPRPRGAGWFIRAITYRHGFPHLQLASPSQASLSSAPLVPESVPLTSWLNNLVDGLRDLTTLDGSCFESFVPRSRREWALPKAGRHRDIFPLPVIDVEWANRGFPDVSPSRRGAAIQLASAGLAGLGCLAGYPIGARGGHPPQAQLSIMKVALGKAIRLLARIESCQPATPEESFQRVFGPLSRENVKVVPFVSDRCDIHPRAGLVNPDKCLPEAIRAVTRDASLMFPEPPPDLPHFGGPSGAQRQEYLAFVCRELAAGKVEIRGSVAGGGTLFAVGKEGDRLRPIWRGDRVSDAAAVPPKPRHLASPTALAQLITTDGAPFVMIKRDGKSMFDQMLLPEALRPFMAQPQCTASALLEISGWSLDQLQTYWRGPGILVPSSTVFPVSRVWCMDFSWSSAVCQEQSLSICAAAGLPEEALLAEDLPRSADMAARVAVATDDIALLSNVSAAVANGWGS